MHVELRVQLFENPSNSHKYVKMGWLIYSLAYDLAGYVRNGDVQEVLFEFANFEGSYPNCVIRFFFEDFNGTATFVAWLHCSMCPFLCLCSVCRARAVRLACWLWLL